MIAIVINHTKGHNNNIRSCVVSLKISATVSYQQQRPKYIMTRVSDDKETSDIINLQFAAFLMPKPGGYVILCCEKCTLIVCKAHIHVYMQNMWHNYLRKF